MRRRQLRRVEQPLEPEEPGLKRLLNAREVGEILHVSTSYACTLVGSGKIARVRIGRNVRVREADLQTFIEGQREEPQQDWRTRLRLAR